VAGDALLRAGGQAPALITVAALPLLPAALALLTLSRLNRRTSTGNAAGQRVDTGSSRR